jgi:hypothetical protein
MDKLPDYREQVVQGQQQGLTQGDGHGLLGRREGGLQPMGAVGAVGAVLAAAPLAHRRLAQGVTACELCGRQGRLAPLPPDRRGRAGILVQVQLHRSRLVRR